MVFSFVIPKRLNLKRIFNSNQQAKMLYSKEESSKNKKKKKTGTGSFTLAS
jgi:hypothetical protein